MTARLSAWALIVATIALIWNLWPLPDDAAETRIAYWKGLRSHWEAADPAKSENPRWTRDTKVQQIAEIDKYLSDTDGIYRDARVLWALWFSLAIVVAAAAIAAWRSLRQWPWLALTSTALLLWLQEPWRVIGSFFYIGDRFDMAHGMSGLANYSKYQGPFWVMVIFNVVLPVLLLAVAAGAIWQLRVRGSPAREPDAL